MSPQEKTSGSTLSPGERLLDLLKKQEMTQVDLAGLMGRPAQYVQDIIKRRKAMDARVAVELEEALGTPEASQWLIWELDYQRFLLVGEQAKKVDATLKRRDVIDEYPFALDAVKYGWIPDSKDPSILRENIQEHLKLASSLPGGSYRTSGALKSVRASLDAWTVQCFRIANTMDAPDFVADKATFEKGLIPELKACMASEEGVERVPEILNRYGIRFFVVPSLRKAPVDGIAALNNGKPFIALSLRHGQVDRFWFVLMHELAHLFYGHKPQEMEYNSLDHRIISTLAERQADEKASEWIMNDAAYIRFVQVSNVNMDSIKIFAASQKIHPAVVLGRLKRDGYVGWQMYAREHPSIRDNLLKTLK